MAKIKGSLFDAPGFSFSGGVLSIKHGGNIAITEATDGSWSYIQGANTYVISASQVNQITGIEAVNKGTNVQLGANALVGDSFTFTGKGNVEVTGLTFTTADNAANFRFEPSVNVDSIIVGALGPGLADVDGALATLSGLFGGEANAIRLLWDYVDDNFSYYNTAINSVGVKLGLAYADYLLDGGAVLTDVAKYAPDGGDAGTAPDRLQMLHDNLLGNLHIPSIVDKFFDGNPLNGSAVVPDYTGPVNGSNGGSNGVADEVTGQALLDAIVQVGLVGRPIYSGVEGADPSASIAFDQAHGLL